MSVCSVRITHSSSAIAAQVREQLADHQARLAAWLEPKRRAHERAVVRLVGPQPEDGTGLPCTRFSVGL